MWNGNINRLYVADTHIKYDVHDVYERVSSLFDIHMDLSHSLKTKTSIL